MMEKIDESDNTAQINKLPKEILIIIFELLNSIDDLLICRLVCKKWLNLFDYVRIENLAIERKLKFDDTKYSRKIYRFSNKSVKFTSVLFKTEDFQRFAINFFKLNLFKKILSRLKKLSINYLIIRNISNWLRFESAINQTKLEHLRIDILYVLNNEVEDNSLEIKFTNLKAFSIKCNKKIKLNSPNLCKLAIFESFDYFEFVYPENITHINARRFKSPNELSQFKNLEYLYLKEFTEYSSSKYFHLIDFPHLKELHLNYLNKKFIGNMIKKKQISRKLNLKLYFADLPINSLNELFELFDIHNRFRLKTNYIIDNYSELVNVFQFESEVDYSILVDEFGDIPDEFFSRFLIVKIIVSKTITDLDKLISFLLKCKKFHELEIRKVKLDQSKFYDNLHIHCPHITRIKIETDQKSSCNFDFLLNHENLKFFSSNQQLNIDLIERIKKKFSFIKLID